MRKPLWILLFGLLALALSSCVVVADETFKFKSNWQRTSDGAYVFCSNRQSRIFYSFRGPDPSQIQAVTETYTGIISATVYQEQRSLNQLTYSGGRYTFEGILTFGSGGIPQSLPAGVSQQAIAVTPITPPPSNTGITTVTVTVTTTSGFSYSGAYVYDVYSNCP